MDVRFCGLSRISDGAPAFALQLHTFRLLELRNRNLRLPVMMEIGAVPSPVAIGCHS